MRRTVLATVAVAALCIPALAQQGQPPNQPQAAPQHTQTQPGEQGAPGTMHQGTMHQSMPNHSAQDQSKARGQEIMVSRLNDNQVMEIQKALDGKGFKVGKVDGKWGRETRAAFEDFQKSQNMAANGRLDSTAIAALGLNAPDFGVNRAPDRSGTTGQAPRSRQPASDQGTNPDNEPGNAGNH
jgi:peptidoglycan hydrolase-like protein with peptidoglycan-binding domain